MITPSYLRVGRTGCSVIGGHGFGVRGSLRVRGREWQVTPVLTVQFLEEVVVEVLRLDVSFFLLSRTRPPNESRSPGEPRRGDRVPPLCLDETLSDPRPSVLGTLGS